jgi:D-3-phosphoglycerate dehydrogenase
MKVLISDNLAPIGEKILKDAGLEVDVNTGLPPEELKAIISDYDGLVIRSATKVRKDIIEAATKLKVVGRAGIGLDNVDIPAASEKGIVVMNAPDGNATTAAEHAISMMMSLSRNIPQATASMKAGKWEKKSFMGREVTGKTLGIVGIGRIGSIVASRAQGLKMKVIAYDPFMPDELVQKLGVERVDLLELAARADYISVHTPLTKDTHHILSTEFFAAMKKEAMFVDCARGGVLDEEALYAALKEGRIAGAALDVFEKEPTTLEATALLGLDNFICTPHLGASTAEAQENVAVAIAEQMADYLLKGSVRNAVNVPSVSDEVLAKIGPYITLGEMLGCLHMQISQGGVQEVNLEFSGDLAEERGIRVVESKSSRSADFTNLVRMTVKTTEGENMLAGTVFGTKEPRLVRFNSFRLEALPAGPMLLVHNKDVPGVIGALGTTLGAGGVNISKMVVGQEETSSRNVILLNTDQPVNKELLATVKELEHIDDAMALELPAYIS